MSDEILVGGSCSSNKIRFHVLDVSLRESPPEGFVVNDVMSNFIGI